MLSIQENSVPFRADDRRAARRQRVLKGGRLSFNNGYGALESVVRDLTERGARLSFGETSAVPQEFALTISGEQDTRRARVRWRSLTQVGVAFD